MREQVLTKTRHMQILEATLGRPLETVLEEMYVGRGMTLAQVAAEFEVTEGTISDWLRRVGIVARRPGPLPKGAAS
jgi:transposase